MAEGTVREQGANPPTGTVTFLFTDIEGSTTLWDGYPLQMEVDLTRHDDILKGTVEAHGGYVFKMVGDACCAAFDHPREALKAALDAQRALFAETWSVPGGLRAKMALKTGVTQERDGDYFGPPVNRVARLLSAAHGGQVLLSDATHNLVREHPELVDEGARLLPLGEHRLKDLTHSEDIYQLSVPDLPERFPPPKADRTPDDFDERYRFKDFLGSGGFAKVYLAHDERLDREVAIKVLHPRYVDEKAFVERFEREARSAARLSHEPNIVTIHDWGQKRDGTHYMVMEYVPGGTLKDLVLSEGPLPASTALGLTLQVAQALEVAHQEGIIHRDIKPQNILLSRRGDAKVADFGIAKAILASTMSLSSALVGTPHYMSPEQGKGEPATFRSDLYSLGVVLYEMLTGKLPHDAETPMGVLSKHLHEQPRPPGEENPNVPGPVEAVAMRLLAKDPRERHEDAAALATNLQRVRDDLEWASRFRGREGEEGVGPRRDDGGAKKDPEDAPTVGPTVTESPKPMTVRIPDLTGQTPPQARDTLADVNLSLSGQNQVTSETVPEGDIVEQDPPAGTEVEPDSSVSIAVSTGPSTVEIPDLTGKSVSQASSELADKGLKLGNQNEAPSDTASRGRITEQNPAAGTKSKPGSPVSITVSSGPSLVEVPDLTGQEPPRARNTLSNAGLVLGRHGKASSGTSPEGQIVGQRPEAGKKVKPNSSVRVTISSGPEEKVTTATIPDAPARSSTEEEDGLDPSSTGPVIAGSPTEEQRASSEGSSRPTVRGASGRSGKPAKLWIGAGLLCAMVVGLITVLAYSLIGEDATGEVEPETANFTLASTLIGHSGNNVISVAFSPDGSLLASSSVDGTVKLWDPRSGEELQTLSGSSGGVDSVAFSPDGGLLASSNRGDSTVKLWDPQSGEELQTLSGHSSSVYSVAFSPDGSLLASGSADGTVKLWDPRSGEDLRTLSGHSGSVGSVAFSPDGNLLASGSFDETVKLWDPQSGEELQTLSGHSWFVGSVAFSPDGSLLASGSTDGTVKLWDPRSGEDLRTLSGHSGSVGSVAFSPDGSLLASSGSTVYLWDPQSGEELRTLSGHSGFVNFVTFSPDGSLLAGSGRGGTVIWERE